MGPTPNSWTPHFLFFLFKKATPNKNNNSNKLTLNIHIFLTENELKNE